MTKLEYFFPRLNGWVSLSLEEYVNILFSQDDQKLHFVKNLRHLPLKLKLEPEEIIENFPTSHLISGNFIEIQLKQELNISASNQKGALQINSKEDENSKEYDIWVQAKIVSFDIGNNLLFLEYNDQIIIVDDLSKIRSLSEKRMAKIDLVLYFIKKISTSDYKSFKKEFDDLKNESNKILYQESNLIKSNLIIVLEKNCVNNLKILKEFEEKYGNSREGESNTNSEFGITSRSGHSEEDSEKNENKSRKSKNSKNSNNVHDEEDLLNQINNFKFKQIFNFNTLFKKDAEKILKNVFIKNKFFVTVNNTEEFKIILYSNDENDFNEEKVNFEREYKDYVLNFEGSFNKNEASSLAKKANVKYIYFGKNFIYLIGDEKSISNFKTVFNVNMEYTKEILKTNKETENIKKELHNLRKKHKIK